MSSNATAESTSEVDCEVPTSPAKPGDPKPPAIAELGERTWYKTSLPPTEISRLAQETEKSWQPRYRWSYLGSVPSARGLDLTSPRLSQPRGGDKARAEPGRSFWPPPLKRRGPASCPGTEADKSRGSAPTQTQQQTPW